MAIIKPSSIMVTVLMGNEYRTKAGTLYRPFGQHALQYADDADNDYNPKFNLFAFTVNYYLYSKPIVNLHAL